MIFVSMAFREIKIDCFWKVGLGGRVSFSIRSENLKRNSLDKKEADFGIMVMV